MRQFLSLGLLVALALLVVTTATGGGTQFATGSAKTDVEAVTGLQHLSFSAHSYPPGPPGFPPSPCAAQGSIVYDTPTLHMKVDVDQLMIDPGSATASLAGPVAWATDGMGNPITPPFSTARFDVLDGDQLSSPTDVTPDAFQFDGFHPPSPCTAPLAVSGPVTSGNIVIKATGSFVLP
jgi:hypothetical protein